MDEQANVEAIAKLSRRAFLAMAAAVGLGRLAIAQSAPARGDIVHTDFPTLLAYGQWHDPRRHPLAAKSQTSTA